MPRLPSARRAALSLCPDHGHGALFLANIFKTIRATDILSIPLERYCQYGSIGMWNFSVALLVPEKLGQIGHRGSHPWSGERIARGPPSTEGADAAKRFRKMVAIWSILIQSEPSWALNDHKEQIYHLPPCCLVRKWPEVGQNAVGIKKFKNTVSETAL